jgi:hypothetical protein
LKDEVRAVAPLTNPDEQEVLEHMPASVVTTPLLMTRMA